MSNQHTPEPNNLEATVFIYRHKRTGKTQAHYIDIAQMLKDDPEWEHLGTVEPRMWIEHHYEAVDQRDELLAALEEIASDYADRFDMSSPSTNPGIKCVVKQARAAIASVKGGA